MNSKVILLIEDNPSDFDLAKRTLEKGRIANELIVVQDGAEALEYLFCTGDYAMRDSSQVPTLILMDLNLPKIGGLELLRRIRKDPKTRRIPVVILTTSQEEQDLAASYDLGVNSYIRKPVDFSKFGQVIEQLGLYWLILNEPPPLVR